MAEVGQLMRETGCKIALLQEPYTNNSSRVAGLPEEMRVFANPDAGAAVVVDDRTLECVNLTNPGDLGVSVRIEGVFGVIVATSVYCRFSQSIDAYLSYIDEVLLLDSSSPIIIGMDANATSPLWFSKLSVHSHRYESHNRGILLEEFLCTRELYVVNERSEHYTFDGPNGSSDIDVTLGSRSFLRSFDTRWSIADGYSLSDHNPIVISVMQRNAQQPVQMEEMRKWRSKRNGWQHYAEQMKAEAEMQLPLRDFTEMNLMQQLQRLQNLVVAVNDRVLGRPSSRDPVKVKWWTRELHFERKTVVRLRRRYRRARRMDDGTLSQCRTELNAATHKYKDMLRQAKENYWRALVSANRCDPWGQVYRACVNKTSSSDVSRIVVDGGVYNTWRSCTRILMDKFFPLPQLELPTFGPDPQPDELEPVELSMAVRQMRSSGSPGLDGITGYMVKAMHDSVDGHLFDMMAKCLESGVFPDEWKIARVVVLLKSSDKPRSNPGSYRGICLLSALGKVLERIMIERLMETIGGAFSRNQFGFQLRKGINHAWMHVIDCVNASNAKYVLGIFVDFKGAFDNLEWNAIIRRLQEVGCKEMALWRSYFSGRKARAVSASQSVEVVVRRGCPQGSVIGPYVWNLMMDVLLEKLESRCKYSAYADDLLLMVEGSSKRELNKRGLELMQIVHDWGLSVGVEVSAEKTIMMLMKGMFDVRTPPRINYGDGNIKYCKTVKYLGIHVGERMNFLPHLKQCSLKMRDTVQMLKRVVSVQHGLSRRSVRTIYKGVFTSLAMYGAPIWYKTAQTSHGSRTLLSCQRIPLLASLVVCRTVSTDALQVLGGVMPWDLEAEKLSIAFRSKWRLHLEPHELFAANLPKIERDRVLQSHFMEKWQRRWEESPHGRTTFRFLPRVDTVYSMPDFGFRLSTGFLLTGHGAIGEYLKKRNLQDEESCRCGEAVEDVWHILLHCPLYADLRNLPEMGVISDGTSFVVEHCCLDPVSLRSLESFALAAFTRRFLQLRTDTRRTIWSNYY